MRHATPLLLLLASMLLAPSGASAAEPVVAPVAAAQLLFVSPESTFIGNTFGLNAVDAQVLVLQQRSSTPVASGVRTIAYSCPGEAAPADGSRMTFDFVPGKTYELVCHGGATATIRESDRC